MRYLLDTNIVSHLLRADRPTLRERVQALPPHAIALSVVTEAELRYGLAKRGHPKALSALVHELLIRVEVLPWTSEIAQAYADLRAANEAAGLALAPLDTMIAAQAQAADATLVTRDQALLRMKHGPRCEDWTQ